MKIQRRISQREEAGYVNEVQLMGGGAQNQSWEDLSSNVRLPSCIEQSRLHGMKWVTQTNDHTVRVFDFLSGGAKKLDAALVSDDQLSLTSKTVDQSDEANLYDTTPHLYHAPLMEILAKINAATLSDSNREDLASSWRWDLRNAYPKDYLHIDGGKFIMEKLIELRLSRQAPVGLVDFYTVVENGPEEVNGFFRFLRFNEEAPDTITKWSRKLRAEHLTRCNCDNVLKKVQDRIDRCESVDEMAKILVAASWVGHRPGYGRGIDLTMDRELDITSALLRFDKISQEQCDALVAAAKTFGDEEASRQLGDASNNSLVNTIFLLSGNRALEDLLGRPDIQYYESTSFKAAIDHLSLTDRLFNAPIVYRLCRGADRELRTSIQSIVDDVYGRLLPNLSVPDQLIVTATPKSDSPFALSGAGRLHICQEVWGFAEQSKAAARKFNAAVIAHELGHVILAHLLAERVPLAAKYSKIMTEYYTAEDYGSDKRPIDRERDFVNGIFENRIFEVWKPMHELFADLIGVLHVGDPDVFTKGLKGITKNPARRGFSHAPLSKEQLDAWNDTNDHRSMAPVRWFLGKHVLSHPKYKSSPCLIVEKLVDILAEALTRRLELNEAQGKKSGKGGRLLDLDDLQEKDIEVQRDPLS